MIHAANHRTARTGVVILGAACALAGCAGSSSDYPSFARPLTTAEQGRVSVQFPALTIPEPATPGLSSEPLPEALDARLAAIYTQAMKANTAFMAQASAARPIVEAAKGAGESSDRWARAQIALAELHSSFSDDSLALADLDLLASRAQIDMVEPEKLAAIIEVQSQIAAVVETQAGVLAGLTAQLEQADPDAGKD